MLNYQATPEMLSKLTFDDLKLHKASFEVRFDDALLMWDRSGVVWSAMRREAPGLKMLRAEPSNVVFVRAGGEDADIHLSLETRRLGAITLQPAKDLSEFRRLVAHFTRVATETLEISAYGRVGLRVSFVKEFSSPGEAADALLNTGLLRLPNSPLFGVPTGTIEPDFSVRREDESNGFSLRLKAETLRFEFQPEFGATEFVKSQVISKHRVHLDVDYYIKSFIEVTKVAAQDWIGYALHLITRDSRRFLEV